MVGINPVGVEVWKRMDGTRNLDEIGAEIRELFRDVASAVDEETGEYVDELARSGFARRQLVQGELLC